MKCLTDEQIAVYLDHRRTDSEYDKIVEHLNSCDRCLSRMTQVYDMLSKPGSSAGEIKVPEMPRINTNVSRFFRLRYIVPASVAAASLLIVFLFNINSRHTAVDIIAGENINGNTDYIRIENHENDIFALRPGSHGVAKIKDDISSIRAHDSFSSVMSLQGRGDDPVNKKMTIDERLALERKLMLMRCGYYYFLIKHADESSMLGQWNELMDMCFPGYELRGLSADAMSELENRIMREHGADRENFIRGFVLSYYIYSGAEVSGSTNGAGFVGKYLKNETLLKIKDMVNAPAESRLVQAEKIRGYFVR